MWVYSSKSVHPHFTTLALQSYRSPFYEGISLFVCMQHCWNITLPSCSALWWKYAGWPVTFFVVGRPNNWYSAEEQIWHNIGNGTMREQGSNLTLTARRTPHVSKFVWKFMPFIPGSICHEVLIALSHVIINSRSSSLQWCYLLVCTVKYCLQFCIYFHKLITLV